MNTEPLHSEREHDADLRSLPPGPDGFGDQLERLDRQVRALVHDRPLATVAVAVGVGFVLGRMLRG